MSARPRALIYLYTQDLIRLREAVHFNDPCFDDFGHMGIEGFLAHLGH
jgi:hypothetical protein